MNKTIVLLVAPLVLLANEPSAYSAGDLDSATPYGLTSSEKHILKNKQEVKTLDKKVGGVKVQLSQVNESYEGLRSVTEAIGTKISQIDAKILELNTKVDTNTSSLSKEIGELQAYVQESRELQIKNQESVKIVLKELSSLIDSINTNYVSKKSFASLEAKVKKLEQAKSSQKTAAKVSQKDGATLLKEAIADYDAKRYSSAKEKFTELAKRNYKRARSNYYLGEIAYFEKSYTTAIGHYKKSLSLYDKASYIPKLLYHTGISFSKLGKKAEANRFFDALKSGYPDSKEAQSLQ